METTAIAPEQMTAETSGAANSSADVAHFLHFDQAVLQSSECISPKRELKKNGMFSFTEIKGRGLFCEAQMNDHKQVSEEILRVF